MTVLIFVVGVVVTMAAIAGFLLTGLLEARDPQQARIEDLTRMEKALVDRDDIQIEHEEAHVKVSSTGEDS